MPEPETCRPSLRDLVHLLNTYEETGALGEPAILFQVENLGPNCLQELGTRLIRPSIPWALKRFIYGLPARLPWPAWTPVLQRALMHEDDPLLFEEGLRVLALMGGVEQTEALRAIAVQRVDEPFSSVLQPKLEWLESRQDFAFHLQDLLRGSRSPALAQRASDHLVPLTGMEQLPALFEAAAHEDGHASRMALRTLARLRLPEAAAFLVETFTALGAAHEEGRLLREALEPLRRLAPKAQAEQILDRLRAALEGRLPEVFAALGAGIAAPGTDLRPHLEVLRAGIQGGYQARLLEALEIVLSDRPGRLGGLTAQVAEGIRRNAPRQHGNLDECALGLVQQVRLGCLAEGRALPLLERAFAAGLGGESVAWAYATLIDSEDAPRLAGLLQNPDHRFREAALTVLGEREDPALLAFLLQASEDSITDLATKVTRFFGRLPGAFPRTLDLLGSGNPDRIRQALRIIEANGWRAAGEALVSLLGEPPREDLLCESVRVLGALHYQPAAPDLLRLLHGGQSAKVQDALAAALESIEQPEAALGLLERAQAIPRAELHLQALRGLGRVFRSPADPIPAAHAEQVRNSVGVCMSESERMRLALVPLLPDLHLLDAGFYQQQLRALAGHIVDQRRRPTWDRVQSEQAGAVLVHLEQRVAQLGDLEGLATRFRTWLARACGGPLLDAQALRGLLDLATADSALWRWPGLEEDLEKVVAEGLSARGQAVESLLRLCDLAGRLRGTGCAAAAGRLRQRTGPASRLHAALDDLLRHQGAEGATPAAPPSSLLLLEPNAFFRRRMQEALQGLPLRLREARDRAEAGDLLAEAPADLLLSESADADGPLYDWLMAQWTDWRVDRILLSTSQREPREVREAPWFHGAITKPFRPDRLIEFLGL